VACFVKVNIPQIWTSSEHQFQLCVDAAFLRAVHIEHRQGPEVGLHRAPEHQLVLQHRDGIVREKTTGERYSAKFGEWPRLRMRRHVGSTAMSWTAQQTVVRVAVMVSPRKQTNGHLKMAAVAPAMPLTLRSITE
jgi:hypothetical protein